jgi:hypothetical protein
MSSIPQAAWTATRSNRFGQDDSPALVAGSAGSTPALGPDVKYQKG